MASLHCCACGRPLPSVLGFRRPNCKPSTTVPALGANLPPTPPNLRFKNAARLQVRHRSFVVFASNTNPPDQGSLKGKSDGAATSDGHHGPPFLTILAGVVVFLVLFWIIGSIVTWLLSLIFNLPSSK
ncbi:uncharacterized protein LOC131334253 isoform X2 [Rhododendron vialii]|uniref:uncharacterized protein LOC131334253 isoform X2 n=1 Tax=Rhododendron vialii TaxID=182163 RepID=UPI00265DCDCC|nr:uncharacterized protein LOC131334253 isoform X2 [Rhododendron vialii]